MASAQAPAAAPPRCLASKILEIPLFHSSAVAGSGSDVVAKLNVDQELLFLTKFKTVSMQAVAV
jgi:hypothetical protein